MKRFEVNIAEILSRTICIEAENYDEAYEIAEGLCNLDIIALDDKDFGSRNIEVLRKTDDNIKYDKIYTIRDFYNEKE